MIEFERLRFPGGIAVASLLKSPGAGARQAKLLLGGFLLASIIHVIANLLEVDVIPLRVMDRVARLNTHVESLRSRILKKNVWWFHRSRPANMAYVFGFRKREQGQNAVEIPQYDQLIVEEEQAIALLRKLDGTSVAIEACKD